MGTAEPLDVAGHDAISTILFAGAGEVRARARALDWAATPLGPVDGWSSALRTAAGLVLASPFPMVLLWGPELAQLYNDGYRALMGGKHPAGLGQRTRDCWPEVWAINAPIYERVRGGESVVLEDALFPIRRHDGDGTLEDAWFTLAYSPVPEGDTPEALGRVGGVLVTVFETTAQVHARSVRERERERLVIAERESRAAVEAARVQADAVLASIADAFYLLDRDWRFTYVNDAAEPLLQTTRAALLGRTLWEAFPEVIGSMFEAPYREAMDTGRSTAVEAYFAPLGTWFDVRTYPWAGGVMVHFRDIGARKRAEVERERLLQAAEAARAEAEGARRTAEAANLAKSQFLAVMSHELRTPLNAIGGYAELIELGVHGPLTDPQRAALGRIQASQRHLLGLIAGVLDYSRVEAGSVRYRLADVPVAEAVAEAEALVAPQLRARGLGYVWSGAPPGLAVRADPEKLQQILLNLLGNAVKFTPARDGVPGRLEVACTVAADGAGDRVRLHVRDTGDGIAAAALERIFEPFVQADQRLTRPHAGVGLGLAISRDLARGMGGDLTVESTPGVGSVFTLALPAA